MTEILNGNVSNRTRKPKRRMKKSGMLILAVLVLIIVLAGGIYYGTAFGAVNLDEEVTVEIPDGAGAKQIGSLLDDNDVVKHKWSFVSYVKKEGAGEKLQPGTYTFGPGKVSLADVVEAMTSGGAMKTATMLPSPRD